MLAGRRQAFAAGDRAAAAAMQLARPLQNSLARPPHGRANETEHTLIMSDTLFGIHGAALEVRSQRMGVLTSNIANAATPGYKAQDVDFGAALQARLAGATGDAAIGGATLYRRPVMSSLDGNTVEMATEQAAFAENAVGYSATLGFLKGRVETVTRAIRGE